MPHTRDELDFRYAQGRVSDLMLEELDKLPALFGGDGSSADTPIIVNAESNAMAGRLILDYISELLGRFGEEWRIASLKKVKTAEPDQYVERHVVEDLDGNRTSFYFDLSRSHGGSVGLLRRAYEMRMLAEAKEGLAVH